MVAIRPAPLGDDCPAANEVGQRHLRRISPRRAPYCNACLAVRTRHWSNATTLPELTRAFIVSAASALPPAPSATTETSRSLRDASCSWR